MAVWRRRRRRRASVRLSETSASPDSGRVVGFFPLGVDDGSINRALQHFHFRDCVISRNLPTWENHLFTFFFLMLSLSCPLLSIRTTWKHWCHLAQRFILHISIALFFFQHRGWHFVDTPPQKLIWAQWRKAPPLQLISEKHCCEWGRAAFTWMSARRRRLIADACWRLGVLYGQQTQSC